MTVRSKSHSRKLAAGLAPIQIRAQCPVPRQSVWLARRGTRTQGLVVVLCCVACSVHPDENKLGERRPYACLPFAACAVLAFFDMSPNYAEITKEIAVDEGGEARVSDLITAVQRRGLSCSIFKGLSITELQDLLSGGNCAVIVAENANGSMHAISVFASGGGLVTTDPITPIHCVNRPALENVLGEDAVCIIVGNTPVSLRRSGWLMPCAMIVGVAVIGVAFFLWFNKKGVVQS